MSPIRISLFGPVRTLIGPRYITFLGLSLCVCVSPRARPSGAREPDRWLVSPLLHACVFSCARLSHSWCEVLRDCRNRLALFFAFLCDIVLAVACFPAPYGRTVSSPSLFNCVPPCSKWLFDSCNARPKHPRRGAEQSEQPRMPVHNSKPYFHTSFHAFNKYPRRPPNSKRLIFSTLPQIFVHAVLYLLLYRALFSCYIISPSHSCAPLVLPPLVPDAVAAEVKHETDGD